MDTFGEKIKELITKYRFPLLLFIAGLICLVYGLIDLSQQKPQNDILFEKSGQQLKDESATDSEVAQTLIIDVAGAVNKPGVYPLTEDSRVKDAIAAAGGLSADADTTLIARHFNFAMKLSDGMKLYLPRKGESSAGSGQATASISNISDLSSPKINLNTASESELDTLPGIGKVTAGKIINGRPYTAPDELLTKKIVSEKVFEQIKESISTY